MTTVITAMLCALMRGLADGQDHVSRLWAALGLLQWLGPRARARARASAYDVRRQIVATIDMPTPTPKVSLGECA